MSQYNLGNQTIVFDYKYPLKGSEFSKLFRGFMKPGIYKGATLSTNDGTQIYISPFKAIFNTSYGLEDTLAVPIFTTENTPLLGVTYINPSKTILCMKFTFLLEIDNFIDFYVRAISDPPEQNEIILGTIIYTGPLVTGFDISNRTLGLLDDNDDLIVENATVTGTLKANIIEYVEELKITDKILTVNDGETNPSGVSSPYKAGMEVDRGPVLDKQNLIWNEQTGKFEIGTMSTLEAISTETYSKKMGIRYAIVLG